MRCWYLWGEIDHRVFLLRDPKWVSISVDKIPTRDRGVCLLCSSDVRVVEGFIEAWIGARTGRLVMGYIQCDPSRSRLYVLGGNSRFNS